MKGGGTMEPISSAALKKYDFFSFLSDGALEALSNAVHTVDLPAGTEIVREGEHGNSFYLICRGEVEITKKSAHGQTAKLSVAGAGESFGETALLTNLPRSCTVTAKTDVKLGEISKEKFDEIINFDTAFSSILERQAGDYAEFNTLKTLQPFALIEPEKMLALISRMDERSFAPGETIISHGEKGDAYYIIKTGRVAVIKKKKSGDFEQVAELRSGSGFGEEALIREEPRNATVRAVDETTVLTVDKKAFLEIMQKTFIENAFPEDLDEGERKNVVFIDARITPEYEEEHIAGAVNIPIEILRNKFDELDRSREYYTYCTNDSRGMTAAFLMKSMGFHVKALRGGLSAWDGETIRGGDGIHTPVR
jgi:CRP-like cAMP-binding protein/rhodanese-related sulfurtransferase